MLTGIQEVKLETDLLGAQHVLTVGGVGQQALVLSGCASDLVIALHHAHVQLHVDDVRIVSVVRIAEPVAATHVTIVQAYFKRRKALERLP